ncbi:MAG TPA: NADH-quinone oxidoreductase subunit J [Gammaproteobacteria bacterium]|nr:NADH-quinone oxidoreductase subunit J [Gammaproteobacteria bacterium]
MSLEKIIFYLFATILVLAALRVITSRNPVHSALYLVLCFFSSAALWILLQAEFLAITLVLVYVGAVMVLFLFVVMMLNINLDVMREGFIKYLPIGITVALISVLEMGIVITGNFTLDKFPAPARKAVDYSNTEAIGNVLYTEYLFSFEIAAVLLLVAIVAAIALTMRKRPNTRSQNPSEQVLVKKSDRLHIVKMDAEEKQS